MTHGHRYRETHPWLTFSLDVRDLDYRSWLLLGEAGSKCSHIAGAPLLPAVAAEMHLISLSRGLHGTTSIEGNTLSEEQVKQRIEGDLPLPKSREYQGREIDNMLAITSEIAQEMFLDEVPHLTADRIKDFNRKILDGLPLKEDVLPGEIRTHSVTVGLSGYRGAPAADCEELLNRLVSWLENWQAPEGQPELRFPLAILKSIMAHLYIAWIHPFADGNGRTARMIEFLLLVRAGLPSPAAHLLSNHYNLTREQYLVELDRTSRDMKRGVQSFINYALQGFVDQLVEQIDRIREHQHLVLWEKLVHDTYRDEETPPKRRQRHLVLDMPHGVVPRNKLRDVSPRVAREYGDATSKTLTRDINALLERGLILKVPGGYRANRAVTAAFLPARGKSHRVV